MHVCCAIAFFFFGGGGGCLPCGPHSPLSATAGDTASVIKDILISEPALSDDPSIFVMTRPKVWWFLISIVSDAIGSEGRKSC